jgi:small conductance mechanosensitive channel
MKIPKPSFISHDLQNSLVNKGLKLILGFIILLVAHHIGRMLKMAVYTRGRSDIAGLNISKESDQMQQVQSTKLVYIIVGNVAYYSILVLALLILLKLLGIEATSIVALLGATGFTIGLALQGTLSDISSGILLGLLQTYTIGDLIEIDGAKGYVRDFNLTHTILTDMDTNALIVIPNRIIAEKTIVNHTKLGQRRVKVLIRISNKYNDFARLNKIIYDELIKYPGVLNKPLPPDVGVIEMGEMGTVVMALFFINTTDYPSIILPIQSHIRQVLADNNVPLISYHL